jgi:hypothetical protein
MFGDSKPLLIALMMVAASTPEMLVNVYQTTQCNNPEDSHFLSVKLFSCMDVPHISNIFFVSYLDLISSIHSDTVSFIYNDFLCFPAFAD